MNQGFKNSFGILGILFFFFGCSQVEKLNPMEKNDSSVFGSEDYADAIVSKVQPQWFEGENSNPKFQLKQNDGIESLHMFFDVTPDLNKEEKTVKFIVTTPEESEHFYHLDITTGQHYLGGQFCEQRDVWKSYRDVIYKPPYTMGVIPRLFDQLGEPQKIVIFGEKQFYSENFFNNYFEARIIGGFIEQVCLTGACLKPDLWRSRLVLVGVQPGNRRFENVNTIAQLQKKVNWKQVRAFIENGQGKNVMGGKYYPAYRMGPNVNAEKTLEFINKNSVYLSHSKLLKIRNSCHKLYDHIWEKIASYSKFEKQILALKSDQERREFIAKNPMKKEMFFYHRFVKGFKRYSDQYKTCLKYIYPSNINHDSDRHWFFTFYSALHLLTDLGYAFDCKRGVWDVNPLRADGKRYISIPTQFERCNGRQVDRAIKLAPKFLDRLRANRYTSYHYLDYDKGYFGTHKKIYSWVKDKNKFLKCTTKKKIIKTPNFPKDVRWKKRRIGIDSKGRLLK